MSDSTIQGVIECVAESLSIETAGITTESRIIADLGADSLDFMDIIFHLDEKFSVNLQKEDFDLLLRLGMTREQAIVDGLLVSSAKTKLTTWLPGLPVEKDLKPADLAQYVTVKSVGIIVNEQLAKQNKKTSGTDSRV